MIRTASFPFLEQPPRLRSVGDAAWTVEFGEAIDAATHRRVLGFCRLLDTLAERGEWPRALEWVPTFRSVTVHFDPEQIDAWVLHQLLSDLAVQSPSLTLVGRRWSIPVCFEADCAPDLADFAESKGCTPEDVVQRLSATVLTVYMLGFLPGFPYLGELPVELDAPRLANPRKRVPARSVAVAGRLCGIYPWASPGGWRLLGRTPIRLFDVANARRPALLAPGDEVVWQPIDRSTYESLDRACRAQGGGASALPGDGRLS